MKYNIPIELQTKLEKEAEFGLFFACLSIGLNDSELLRKECCDVTDLQNSKSYPRYHWIRWKESEIEHENIQLLDENSDDYSFSQRLWIIAMKHKPKNI